MALQLSTDKQPLEHASKVGQRIKTDPLSMSALIKTTAMTRKHKMAQGIDLSNNTTDRITALARSVASVVPVFGGLLSEIITEVIPNQRIDRVEKYLIFLTKEIQERKLDDKRLRDDFSTFLIEEGFFQAARSITDERRQLIAHCVAEGLSQEHKDKLQERKILDRLGELDDDEILILDAHGDRHNRRQKFDNIRPDLAVFGAPDKVHLENLFYKAAHKKLERLGLLFFRINISFETKLPKFDSFTGEPEGHYTITRLGELVLERIGLAQAKKI